MSGRVLFRQVAQNSRSDEPQILKSAVVAKTKDRQESDHINVSFAGARRRQFRFRWLRGTGPSYGDFWFWLIASFRCCAATASL